MLPITLDLTHLPVALVGNGPQTLRRLALLDEAGAERLQVFAPHAGDDLVQLAGQRLHHRWPTPEEISATRLLLIADGIDRGTECHIVAVARAAGTLVNVEDNPAHSDFHSPALLRRGDLTIAISTAGRSPALARRLRHSLELQFGPEWQQTVEELAEVRHFWRAAGAGAAEVSAWTEAWLDRQCHPFTTTPSASIEGPPLERNSTRGGYNVPQAW